MTTQTFNVPPQRLRVAIMGARGYTARELIRIALRHRRMEIAVLQARVDKPVPVGHVFGEFAGEDLPPITADSIDGLPGDLDAVFLCLPHTEGAARVPALLERGLRVFDLSADFRFRNVMTYQSVYGVKHPAAEYFSRAVYGLPELHRPVIGGANLVACPGCYPTATTLALAPLMRRDMIVPGTIIADCKSGVSGAGRTPTDTSIHGWVNENVSAYKVAEHRHQPEIEEQLSLLRGERVNITFVPHLMPMDRGILATCYVTLKEAMAEADLRSFYQNFYRNEPFVRLLDRDIMPATKNVTLTNYCDLNLRVDPATRRLIVITAIDNLVKGASGQAVQCFNLSFGCLETEGLR